MVGIYVQIFKCPQIKKWGLGLHTVSNHSVLRLPFSFWDWWWFLLITVLTSPLQRALQHQLWLSIFLFLPGQPRCTAVASWSSLCYPVFSCSYRFVPLSPMEKPEAEVLQKVPAVSSILVVQDRILDFNHLDNVRAENPHNVQCF